MKKTIYVLFLTCILLVVSCGDDEAVKNLLGTSVTAPVYSGFKVVSGTQVDFYFLTDVKVLEAAVLPDSEIEKSSAGNVVSINFARDRSGGEKLIADILVEDENGNTLNVLVPFRTRNDRLPRLVMNEVRFDYGSGRSEFIELKILEDGNLGAMRLNIVSADAFAPVYEFPPVEVKAGDYVIVHLRTLATDTAVDELDSELNLAQAKNAADAPRDARDLWLPLNKKLIHKTDVVYLLDQDEKIADALIVCENEKAWKKNPALASAAEFLAKQGKWLSKDGISVRNPGADDAVRSEGLSTTKTLCRYEGRPDTRTNADWYVCAVTGANTPGKTNREP